MDIAATLKKAHEIVVDRSKRLAWLPLLVNRVTLGGLFASTGWGKVHNLDKVAGYFAELHIPMPGVNAVMASITELVGGTLLVLGLGSRLAAIPLSVTMLVAIVTAKRDEIHNVFDLFGQVEFTYLVMLILVVFFGPGKLSLDRLIERRVDPNS